MHRLFVSSLLISLCIALPGCKDKQSSSDLVADKKTGQDSISTNTAKEENKVILCFGNSLTAGYGLNGDQSWPHLLQERIDSLGLKYEVVNAGLSGETTAGGLNRIDWVLKTRPDIFILELGANDMLRGLDVGETRQNLDNIIRKVREINPGIPVIIAGMLSAPNMGEDYAREFNAIYSELAVKWDAELIPFFLEGVAGVDSLNLNDRIHPNAYGQRIVLENVWEELEGLL